MKRMNIYLPLMPEYYGIILTAQPDERYSAKESVEELLDFLDELPHGILQELFRHPRFDLTRRLAKPLNEREPEMALKR